MNAFNYNPRWGARTAIAAVWLYEGLWCKILGAIPRQASIAAGICGLSGRAALMSIGILECGIAAWVMSGRKARLSALVQSLLLIAMNAAGLIWARQSIPDPAGMVVQNFAFLTLVWHALYL